jgi:hypothetical protein
MRRLAEISFPRQRDQEFQFVDHANELPGWLSMRTTITGCQLDRISPNSQDRRDFSQ